MLFDKFFINGIIFMDKKEEDKKAEEPAAAQAPAEVKSDVNEETLKVLSEIRDLLKEKNAEQTTEESK